jgi:hypothetical protein
VALVAMALFEVTIRILVVHIRARRLTAASGSGAMVAGAGA